MPMYSHTCFVIMFHVRNHSSHVHIILVIPFCMWYVQATVDQEICMLTTDMLHVLLKCFMELTAGAKKEKASLVVSTRTHTHTHMHMHMHTHTNTITRVGYSSKMIYM